MSMTNPRVGARVTAQNTTASGTDANITPALPASLVNGDLLICVDVVFRNLENRSQSSASTPATPTGWTRKATNVALGGPKTGTGASPYHSSTRLSLYYTRYQSSGSGGVNTAPSIVYGPSSVTTDWHSAQIIAFTGALAAGDPTDVLGAFTALDASLAVAAAASTSTLGPATSAAAVANGGAVVVALSGEYPLSTGSVPTLAGDSLTWAEASEYGAGGTDAHTLAIDYALLLPSTAVTVTDKSAAVTFGTAAKSIGQMWLFAPEPVVDSGGGATTTGLISAQGTIATASGFGVTTVAVNPVNAGDCLVLGAYANGLAGRSITAVTGGGATGWRRLAGPVTLPGFTTSSDLWIGDVVTPGSATITVTWSSSVASVNCQYGVQEFTSGGGAATVWTQDGTGATSSNSTSSTVVTLPTRTPTAADRCYVGYGLSANAMTGGSQSAGFTMQLDSVVSSLLYNTSVATAQSPTVAQNSAGTSSGLGALLIATNPGGSAVLLPAQRRRARAALLVR